MFNISMRLWVAVALLVSVNVAGLLLIRQEMLSRPLPGLRLLSVSAGDKIEEADRFVLKFDEPVAKLDLCGSPVEHAPFVIEPAPAGRWQWEQPDQLVYLLDAKLPAGREYVIRPAPNAQESLGHRLIGESEYRFRTQPLKLTKTSIRAFDRSDVTFELAFNQPVAPGDLLRQLTVREPAARGNFEVQCLNKEPAAVLTVRFARPASQKFEIELAAALTGDGGSLALGEKVNKSFTLAEKFTRTGVEVHQRSGVEAGATVELEFNRSLDPLQDAAKVVAIDPPVKDLQFAPQHDSLHITGPFESGRSYNVTIAPTVLASDGQTLGRAESLRVEIPPRSPALSLGVSRGVLMPDGNLTLDLKAINVESLKLTATKVHANNLVAHLRGDYDQRTSRQIAERDVVLPAKVNELQTLAIDLKELLAKSGGGAPGTYRIGVRASKPRWLSDDAVVCISDLGITAKKQTGGYHVFVSSLRTAKPAEGVKLAAITYNNQTIAEAETDADGVGVLRCPSNHPDGPVFVITAQLGEDMSYLQPDRRTWVLDEVDQSGRPAPETYDVMVYAERGVYRPGDTIHLTGIVREPDGRTPPPLPLSIRVRRPDGRLIAELPVKTAADKQGVFHVDVPTSSDDMTGKYTFTATLPGSLTVLGQGEALVEAFAPIRIEVNAEPAQPRFGPKDQPKLNVAARYLFGQPASGLTLTVTPALRTAAHESKRFADYSFDTGQATTGVIGEKITRQLDAQGEAAVEFDASSSESPRLWRATLTATVTEAGGRSVSQNASVLIDKVDRHLGLRLPGRRVVATRTATTIDWCLVNGGDESVQGGEVKAELFRVENDWTLQTVNGQGVWKSTERVLPVSQRVLPKGEAKSFEIECPSAGVHRLVLTEAGTKVSSQLQFYAAENAGEFTSPPVASPQRLEIVLDKKAYKPGENAKVIVRSPFVGTLLVTVETTRVLQHHVLEMKENTATLELPIAENIRGGAFVSASVIRPIDPSRDKWLPHRAMSVARISTDHADRVLDVKLQAPAEAEPGQTVTIHVEAPAAAGSGDGSAMAHVWAVDDGILLTTAYRTPQPHAHFFSPRAASVTSSDLFADLLPDHRRPAGMLRIGGDGDEEEVLDKDGNAMARAAKLRRSPVDIQQREAAVIWRAAQPLGPDGKLAINMTMPKVTGRMRIMAVVVEGDQYGSANHALTLTSPLLVEANWPRFAAPGDVFDVPVKLFNSTKQALEVELSVDVQGPVKVMLDGAPRRVTVKPDQPATVWLKASATGVGQITAVVRVSANASELNRPLRGDCEAKFTIRPITPLHMESQLASLPAGKSLDLKLPDVFEPGSASMKVTVSASPTVELRPAVEKLLDYPYGCVEQTTSRLIAILLAPQLIALEGTDEARIESARAKIAAGIARLWSMQTRSGGLAYWPGDDRPTLWGTCYAAAFLAQAHKAGHRLDARFVDELAKYLQSELDRSSGNDSSMDDNLRAMICRTLATFGKPQEGWTARLTERVKDLDMEGRAHLAATWFELGRKDKAMSVLPADTVAIAATTTTNHRITSPTRQDAALLDALMQIEPTHAWAPLLARRLNDRRGGGYWGTTLDNAAALSALTRYQLRGTRKAAFTGEIVADGATALRFDHKQVAGIELPATVKAASVSSQGEGQVYVTMVAEGLLKADAIKPYESNLRIARRWLTREGKPVDEAKLRVGDLIHVEVDIAAMKGNAVHNIAIVDALPAGMEVENPRLATSAAAATADGPRPDRVEYLDDRVVVFTSATAAKRTYKYALRVTGAGQFVLPPLQASCMYDASYAAMTQRGDVVIGR